MHAYVLIYIVIVNEELYITLYREMAIQIELNLSALIESRALVIYCRGYLLMFGSCKLNIIPQLLQSSPKKSQSFAARLTIHSILKRKLH